MTASAFHASCGCRLTLPRFQLSEARFLFIVYASAIYKLLPTWDLLIPRLTSTE